VVDLFLKEVIVMPDIRIDNVTFHYETAGQGQHLLFLNGLGMSARDWERQVDYFSKSYRVITFDYRGQGSSDKPSGPYSIPLFCEDTVRLLESIDARPVHLVGLSMGGMIAFQMAVSRPELLRSMVIVNSGPHLKQLTWAQKFEFLKRRFIVRVFGMRVMAKILADRLFPENGQENLRREMAKRWAQNDKNAYNFTVRALRDWSVLEHLGEIRCPALVISADQDYTPLSYKQYYVSMMPDAKLVVIPNSRHATPLDQPESFNEILSEFLKAH
jgi:pimeloyl-ACP methyl ester carboxylesterase